MVIGASENPERYSNKAIRRLTEYKHEVIAIGLRTGSTGGVKITTGKPVVENIDTVTLYLNPRRQREYYDYILQLQPKRIIFNPGAENAELERAASEKGIETIEACTLVMLSTNTF